MAHLIGIPMLLLVTALATLTASSRLFVKQELLDLSLYLYCISALLCVTAIGVQIYNCRRVWQASRGIGATCEWCDMPATKRNGVHGPYLHCWQCGHNHSVNSF
ncbi:MAG TPA: hypothetical protein VGO72_02320, partial [Herminiimonas sp.]|nr:hypothetical protein [Herminiimonas sp.]